MDLKKVTQLLAEPQFIEASEVSDLQSIIKDYPYFQSIKALHLKALKKSGSFVYNQKLKETAAHTTDREVLFQFITNFNTVDKPSTKTVHNKETTDAPALAKKEEVEEKTVVSHTNPTTIIAETEAPSIATPIEEKNILEPDAPLEFSKNETHSFSEWLKLTSITPIIREEEEKNQKKKLIESPLIERFLKNNPKIKPVKKSSPPVNLAVQNTADSERLMTETLAKVYIAQKNYKKAIQAYKILSLKNPEKSGLFADQIRAIKKLQDNNQ